MSDQRIWAPWRIGYVSGGEAEQRPVEPQSWHAGAEQKCFLCRAAASYDDPERADRQMLVIERGRLTVTMLNRYPYSNGHLLISPLRHIADFASLGADEHTELMQQAAAYTELLRDRLRADGFNVGLNVGAIAGAGVPGHLHWHVVPRWPGDHNFMPTTAGARVIPQSLEAVWEKLTGREFSPAGEDAP